MWETIKIKVLDWVTNNREVAGIGMLFIPICVIMLYYLVSSATLFGDYKILFLAIVILCSNFFGLKLLLHK